MVRCSEPAPAAALTMMPHPVTSQTFLPQPSKPPAGRAGHFFVLSKRQQARAGSNLKSFFIYLDFEKYIKIFCNKTHFFHIFHILPIGNIYTYVCMRRQREKRENAESRYGKM